MKLLLLELTEIWVHEFSVGLITATTQEKYGRHSLDDILLEEGTQFRYGVEGIVSLCVGVQSWTVVFL